MIDSEGGFQEEGLSRFVQQQGVIDARTNYQVVAIMGPQSSGKSTLMNHVVSWAPAEAEGPDGLPCCPTLPHPLCAPPPTHHPVTPCCPLPLLLYQFGTPFQEMDAMTGRQQTTKGVWLAKAPKVDEVCTLILDLEGSDGRERGEDDTNFERQSALFALAVADVLLINVWCHDIGREQGSGKPLMKTIFQVLRELWPPSSSPGDNSWRVTRNQSRVKAVCCAPGPSRLHACLRRQRPPASRCVCLPLAAHRST